MHAVLTEVALQLKGNLAFLLGLGGMFTIVKTALTGLLVMPSIESDRPSIALEARTTRKRLIGVAILSFILFAAALALYFCGPVSSIDPEAIKKGEQQLTRAQEWAVAWLIAIAVVLVVCECISSLYRYRLSVVATRS